MSSPSRGEIWSADLNPTRGHEQAGKRPVLIISDDRFNISKAELVIVIPLTRTTRIIPSQIIISPPEGSIKETSAILCEAIRSIDKGRLEDRWGEISLNTLSRVEDALKLLLKL